MFNWDESNKEFICRGCGKYLNSKDLTEDGDCPVCETDENIFLNEEII